jgi:hypothetical protein
MKNAMLCGLAAMLLLPSNASAADFYIYGAFSKIFAESETDNVGDVEIESFNGGALGFGWDFAAGTALEILIDGAGGESELNGADVAQGAISLNLYYAPKLGAIQPRVGGGLGVIAIDVDGAAGDPEAALMVQGSGGAHFWIGDHFALGPTYRFRYTEAEIDGLLNPETTEHIFEAGAKVSF